MKRITTLSAMVFGACCLFAANTTNETVLATYEKPMGEEPVTLTVFCETPPKAFVLFNGVVANSVKDETMNSTNNAYMVKLDANHDWWANFLNFRMDNAITITESNRYLHILHYREKLNDTWMICLNVDWPLADADKGKLRFDGQNAKAGVWEDIVIDLKHLIDNQIPLSKFMFGVSMDWNGPRDNPGADYYFDEIVLSSNPLPRGINILPDTEMSLFMGNQNSWNKWVSRIDLQNAESTYEIVDNPFTTEMAVLNSPKVMKFNKSANAAWWQGPMFKFPGILKVGENEKSSYLHVMINIPEMEASKDYYVVQLNAKDFSGKQIDSGDEIKYWSDDKGKWIDCVLDVTSLGYVSEFTVRFDVRRNESDQYINSPAGTFYLDAAAINNSEEPRTVVEAPSSTGPNILSDITIFSNGNTIFVQGDVISAEVFSLMGKPVAKASSSNHNLQMTVQGTGMYIVKTTTSNGSTYNRKIVIL
jgi:hypothetical protein